MPKPPAAARQGVEAPGRSFHLFAVVPAKAGTHNHRWLFGGERCHDHFARSLDRAVWVPAFAGTTGEFHCPLTISGAPSPNPLPTSASPEGRLRRTRTGRGSKRGTVTDHPVDPKAKARHHA